MQCIEYETNSSIPTGRRHKSFCCTSRLLHILVIRCEMIHYPARWMLEMMEVHGAANLATYIHHQDRRREREVCYTSFVTWTEHIISINDTTSNSERSSCRILLQQEAIGICCKSRTPIHSRLTSLVLQRNSSYTIPSQKQNDEGRREALACGHSHRCEMLHDLST